MLDDKFVRMVAEFRQTAIAWRAESASAGGSPSRVVSSGPETWRAHQWKESPPPLRPHICWQSIGGIENKNEFSLNFMATVNWLAELYEKKNRMDQIEWRIGALKFPNWNPFLCWLAPQNDVCARSCHFLKKPFIARKRYFRQYLQ